VETFMTFNAGVYDVEKY